jgi:hypothetical protein
MVDDALGDSPTADNASSLALLDAYMQIVAEVWLFVSSLDEDVQWNLTGGGSGFDPPLAWNFGWNFGYLGGRDRDPSEAEVDLRRLGDWLQHLIDTETLAQQWGGSRKAYRGAHLQLGTVWDV